MRALVKYAPGKGNVGVREMPVRQPEADEILIKIKYCGICGTDLHIEADEFPNSPPVIMGHEYCGTIVQVGARAAADWQVGDRVVGELHTGACGVCRLCLAGKPHICDSKLALGSKYNGAFAEYLTLPARLAHRIPEGVSWEVACVTEPFAITNHCLLERGHINYCESVLISGSATMGLMSTILCSYLGVHNIIVSGTTVDRDQRFPLALDLGATRVVDVTAENLADVVNQVTGGSGVDGWIECSGSASAINAGIQIVRKTAQVVLIGLVGPATIQVPWNQLLYKELDLFACFSSPPSSWDKALAAEPQVADKLRKLVTRIIPLDEWEQGFGAMRKGEAVKILVDMEA
ncbi:MAG: zinc-dependent alcohol dehydrogenase [Anaerolineae bacterium]